MSDSEFSLHLLCQEIENKKNKKETVYLSNPQMAVGLSDSNRQGA